jgi:hypothetical protein
MNFAAFQVSWILLCAWEGWLSRAFARRKFLLHRLFPQFGFQNFPRRVARQGGLAKLPMVGYTHCMIITADAKRRVTLPKPAHPGDAFALETTHHGQFVLTRLEKPARKVKLSREGGFLVATSGRRITMAETRKLMDKIP